MKLRTASQSEIWPERAQYHVLTYAEEGFAPLNIHTRGADLTKSELVEFAESVNRRNEVGTLHPKFSLSAVPRNAVRSNDSAELLQTYLEEFFRANAVSLQARKVICDFRTPDVPSFVRTAIERASTCAAAKIVEELVVIH